jgi:hypothetical protein
MAYKDEMEKEMARYEAALNAAQALEAVPHDCHDCGATPGELHKIGCDSPHCTICGTQLLQCGHVKGNSVHTGIESQEVMILCEAMSLFSKWVVDGEWKPGLERGHWQACGRDDPAGSYDLNKGTEIYIHALLAVRRRELAELENRKKKTE